MLIASMCVHLHRTDPFDSAFYFIIAKCIEVCILKRCTRYTLFCFLFVACVLFKSIISFCTTRMFHSFCTVLMLVLFLLLFVLLTLRALCISSPLFDVCFFLFREINLANTQRIRIPVPECNVNCPLFSLFSFWFIVRFFFCLVYSLLSFYLNH